MQQIKGKEMAFYVLVVYAALAMIANKSTMPWPLLHLGIIILSGGFFWYIGRLITKKEKTGFNLAISMLIITLTWHYGSGWSDLVWPIFIMLGVMIAKYFMYYRGTSLINPAVAGLWLATIGTIIYEAITGNVAGGFISWWGTNAMQIPMLVLIGAWTIIGTIKFKKQQLVISFLLTYFIALALLQQWNLMKFIFTDPTIYFLVSIMLIEPKSSPIMPKDQIITGVMAAILLCGLNRGGISYGELWMLLFVNAANVYFKLKMLRNARAPRT